MKAYRAEFFGGNLQLRSACKCSLRWNFFHFIITLKLPPPKANQRRRQQQQQQQQQHSRPCHPCTAGGTFPSCSEFLVLSGKKIHVYTNHRCDELVFLFFLTATVKRGQGNTQLPPGYVCHNYSVGQLSPSLIKR